MASRTIKASDKARVCRKLVASIHKLYGKSSRKVDLPVLETLLFAACLEDNDWEAAEAGYQKLFSDYFDLNEVRVSSVVELEQTLLPLRFADWKGLRIRSILRHVFETGYSFEFEKLRRLNADSAVRALKKIDDISPFIRNFTLYHALGNHVVYLDESLRHACVWLGLVPPSASIDEASELLRPAVRKPDVFEFCLALRQLATDPKHTARLAEPPEEELTILDAPDRLVELQSPPKRKRRPAPASGTGASAAPKKPAGSSNSKKSAASGKSASRKSSAKKSSAKKPVARKK